LTFWLLCAKKPAYIRETASIFAAFRTANTADGPWIVEKKPSPYSRRKQQVKGYITIDKELCKECHLCIQSCKKSLITPSREYNSRGYRPVRFNEDKGECTGCALCAISCPDIAIEVYRE